jgi:hypothetical protein
MSDLTTPHGIRDWARTLPDDGELMALKAGTLKRIIFSLFGEIDRLSAPHHKIETVGYVKRGGFEDEVIELDADEDDQDE